MEKVKKKFLVKITPQIWLAEIGKNHQQEMYWFPKTCISMRSSQKQKQNVKVAVDGASVSGPSPRLRKHCWSMWELEDGEDGCEMPSGFYIGTAHRNSQQLWLSIQNLHKIKPAKNSNTGTGKIAQELRACIALPEDLDLILSTHIRWLTTACSSRSPLASACI